MDFGLASTPSRSKPQPVRVQADPSTGLRLVVEAHRADNAGPGDITLDMEFADEGGEAPTPYEVLLLAALLGESGRFKRQDVVERTGGSCNRCLMHPAMSTPTRQDLGGPRPPTDWWRATAAGTVLGRAAP